MTASFALCRGLVSMSDEHQEPICRECKKPLPGGARICTECSSYQDWRRFLFRWSGLLTAALAIVPLWSGAYSLWTLAFPEPARVNVATGSCRADQVSVHVSNVGGAPAVLGAPSVGFVQEGRWSRFDMNFPMDEDDVLAEPNEIDIFTLSPTEGRSFSPLDDGACQLKVKVPVTAMDGSRQDVEAECTCSG
jgi:hypothetical protein